MKVRICPLCDQPMKKAHRCDYCNSFVWKPQYLDIHYNTDTMKGQDCSYDSGEHDYDYHEDGSVTMVPLSDKKKKKRRDDGSRDDGKGEVKKNPYTVYREPVQNRMSDSEKRPPGRAKVIIILLVAFSAISMIAEIIGHMEKRSSVSISGTVPNPVVEDTEDIYGEDGGWYSGNGDGERIEYTDEEVMAGGRECTGIEHMEVTIDEFVAAVEPELSKLGVDISYFSDTSNNYSYDYGRDYSYTYFVQERMYDMETDIGYYYNISWDTFSKKLHEVSYSVCDSERAEEFYVSTMQALTGNGEKFRKEFQKQRGAAEKDEYVFFDTDGYEVYINYYEGYSDSYYISIDKAM